MTIRVRAVGVILAWVWALQLSASCAVDGAELAQDQNEVGITQQAVLNGSRAPLSALPDNGSVLITGGRGICSGTLITNRWVLTADHCFCQSSVDNPTRIDVTVYGYLDAMADPTRAAHYKTVATKVVRHPSLDVALVKLKETLPNSWPARIYTGNGSDLPGQTARVIGFGNNRIDSAGIQTGIGQSQSFGYMRIHDIVTVPAGELLECSNPSENYNWKSRSGPRLVAQTPNGTRATFGDSGGGAFIGDLEQAKLVGVCSGGLGDVAQYVGIWHFRDWIKQHTDIWTLDECVKTLPNGTADRQAIATGPDDRLHAVAVFPDTSVGHWSSADGKSWSWIGLVPSARTASTPALTMEVAAAAGQPRKLGLAFRNPSNDVLTYARWSASGGWSTPQPIPSGLKVKGGLAGYNGIIAFAGLDNRAGLTAFDAPSNTWLPAQWTASGAPAVDTTRGISVVHDQTAGLSLLGYRTTSNQWVQAYGSWSCVPTTGSYLCANDPPYATDWIHASLAYVSGDRIYLETVRQTAGGGRIEQRTVSGAASYDWGWSNFVLGGNLAVTDFKGEVYTLRSNLSNVLTIGPAGNCLNAQF